MFLLLQAIIPWVIGIAYWYLADRPLLIERFLAFSQLALLAARVVACRLDPLA